MGEIRGREREREARDWIRSIRGIGIVSAKTRDARGCVYVYLR